MAVADYSAALDWAGSRLGDEPLLVYATAQPEAVKAVQAALGDLNSRVHAIGLDIG